jgi:hypothetical protein
MSATADITAAVMIAWSAPSPSSPAPAARRYAALGLDRSVRPSKVGCHANDGSLSMCPRKSTFEPDSRGFYNVRKHRHRPIHVPTSSVVETFMSFTLF